MLQFHRPLHYSPIRFATLSIAGAVIGCATPASEPATAASPEPTPENGSEMDASQSEPATSPADDEASTAETAPSATEDPGSEKKQVASTNATAPEQCKNLKPSRSGKIHDLEDQKLFIPGLGMRSGKWRQAQDNKGSKVQPLEVVSDGADGTGYSLHAKGKTGSEPEAWGALAFVELNNWEPYDASRYAGISFWAKAAPDSIKTIKFKVPDAQTTPVPDKSACDGNCYNDFVTEVELGTEWKKYTIHFAELAQGNPDHGTLAHLDMAGIFGFYWQPAAKGKSFEFWVDEIELLKCAE